VSNPDPLIERELQRAKDLNLFEPGELLVESEVAIFDGNVGTIFVTDRCVMFVSTTLIRKKTRSRRTPLSTVTAAAASPVWGWGMKNVGEVTIRTQKDDPEEGEIVFRQIPGGVDRATEIAESILRERDRHTARDLSEP